MERLRADYTEVWCAQQNRPLARFADATASIVSTGLDLVELNPPERTIGRLLEFDDIVSWYGANRPEFKEAVAGLPFTFFPALPADSTVHAADFYGAQAGCELPAIPCIEVPQLPREDFVIIHPFASSPQKRWPIDRFQQLARRIGRVHWCAGPEEQLDGAVRISDLYDLACWIATARAYVGNDSGITHLAAAIGTPVVALFGPTNATVWAPRGSRIRVLPNMGRETPERVVSVLESIIL